MFGALGVLGAVLGPRAWDDLFSGTASTSGSAMGSTNGSKLVLLTLYGGNDGLNTVIPFQNPAYASARGALAVEPSTVLSLADGFGLHPGMPGFKKLWDTKELAIVHGVGFADPNYSHFESMDIWQAGSTDAATSTGWLGRWLDGTIQTRCAPSLWGRPCPPVARGARAGRGDPGRPADLPR